MARLAISQAAIPFVYGNYGDQNGVASGLSRGLRLRFGDKPKDVVVIAGDGGTADIGFQQVLHSWFRKERFTTIMLDNEVYGNTGGQESGMTTEGPCTQDGSPRKEVREDGYGHDGQSFRLRLHRHGCAQQSAASGKRHQEGVLIAREVGPTTSKPIRPATSNMRFPLIR